MSGAQSAMVRNRNSLSCRAAASLADSGQAEVGIHARQEFADGEGLHQIVVGARVQPFDARFLTGAGGEQNDRNGFGAGI